MTLQKKIAFYAIMLSIPLLAVILSFSAYLGFKKLTFSYGYCGSYGQFDDELGWRLKPDASSCFSLKNQLAGVVYFDTKIFTNSGGFRDGAVGRPVPANAVMTIGDSWVFGYGVDHEQSFPSSLSQALGAPVINAGIPAYGSGSNLLLAARNAAQYRPSVVIYHTRGMHTRSLCSQAEAEATLVPCFTFDPKDNRVALIKPRPGAVAQAVSHNVYPGGSLTAGYDSLIRFMLFVRIPEVTREIMHRVLAPFGLGGRAEPAFDDKHIGAVLEFELREYRRLSEQHGFAFVLVDPVGTYGSAFAAVFGDRPPGAVYLGPADWQRGVSSKVRSLSESEAWVPMDGHYGPGQNRIVGEFLAGVLRERLPERVRARSN